MASLPRDWLSDSSARLDIGDRQRASKHVTRCPEKLNAFVDKPRFRWQLPCCFEMPSAAIEPIFCAMASC